jgi:NAD(P)H-nitrite reductase large subunit
LLLTAEVQLPYDRTKLSKAYLAGKAEPTALPLRKKWFYEAQRVELLSNVCATGIDTQNQEMWLADQPPLRYNRLLLAPGTTPNLLSQLPGHDLNGVLPLRSRADADALLESTREAAQVVVIGFSFIRMETAASLVADDRQVMVVARRKPAPCGPCRPVG